MLTDDYYKGSKKIARYLTTLQRPIEITTKEFRQFKDKVLRYLVQDRHLFLRSSKTAPLRRVVDRDITRQEILEALHDKSSYRGREGTYRRIADRYY